MNITLTLPAQDLEPLLSQAAFEAAKYGAFCDFFTRRMMAGTHSSANFDEWRKEWSEKFRRAKRIVEAFGVEYEPTSEQETLGIYIPQKVLKSHVVHLGGGLAVEHIDESVPDPKNAMPSYTSGIHNTACKAAAERVTRRWQESLRKAA